MTEENREQEEDSNTEIPVNRGDAAHFDITEHPGPGSEEAGSFRTDSILEKTMRPLTFDNFKCKVCRKRKETRKQGKSATSQNVICLDCFDQGIRLIMETSKRTDNTPQTMIVDSRDEATRSILPNPDQPKGAVIIDLETGEQTWPTEDEEDDLQQVMPLGSGFTDSSSTEPASGDEEDMDQPEIESRPDPDDPKHAHKFSNFPGEIHYHLEVPEDPSTVTPGQKYIQIGNHRMLKEIWQDYNEARRRATQIRDEMGIQRDQISVRKCECRVTYWPDQPRENPPPSRRARRDAGQEENNNGAPSQGPADAPSVSNTTNNPEDAATGREETSLGRYPGHDPRNGGNQESQRDNPHSPNPSRESIRAPAGGADEEAGRGTENEETEPADTYRPRPQHQERMQRTQPAKRERGWTMEDEITKNAVFLESVNNQMRYLNEDVPGNQAETIARRLVQIRYLIDSWLRE